MNTRYALALLFLFAVAGQGATAANEFLDLRLQAREALRQFRDSGEDTPERHRRDAKDLMDSLSDLADRRPSSETKRLGYILHDPLQISISSPVASAMRLQQIRNLIRFSIEAAGSALPAGWNDRADVVYLGRPIVDVYDSLTTADGTVFENTRRELEWSVKNLPALVVNDGRDALERFKAALARAFAAEDRTSQIEFLWDALEAYLDFGDAHLVPCTDALIKDAD